MPCVKMGAVLQACAHHADGHFSILYIHACLLRKHAQEVGINTNEFTQLTIRRVRVGLNGEAFEEDSCSRHPAVRGSIPVMLTTQEISQGSKYTCSPDIWLFPREFTTCLCILLPQNKHHNIRARKSPPRGRFPRFVAKVWALRDPLDTAAGRHGLICVSLSRHLPIQAPPTLTVLGVRCLVVPV